MGVVEIFLVLAYILILILLIYVINLWIEVKSMKQSTHQIIQLNPDKQQFEVLTEEAKALFNKDIFKNVG